MSIYCLSTTVICLSHFCLKRGLDHVWKGVGLRGAGAGGSRPSGSTPMTPTLFDSKCADLFDRSMFSL